jgi:hypothetical protein
MLRSIARRFGMVADCFTQQTRQPGRPPEHISTGTVVKCSPCSWPTRLHLLVLYALGGSWNLCEALKQADQAPRRSAP